VQEVKPSFFKLSSQTLIQTVRPWDRLSVDFKGRDIGPNIGVAKGAMPPEFLTDLVILCFERRYPKQNSVIC